jgi:transposase-like protein
MFSFGPPANLQARREWWRRQIQRQRGSNITVAEFCRRLGASPVTFYAWKRRLRETAPASPLVSRNRQPRPTAGSNGAPTADFLPVSIRESGFPAQLEIELGNACVVRLKGTIDPKLLRAAIRAAGQLGETGQGAD